jgi:hypothetical protein
MSNTQTSLLRPFRETRMLNLHSVTYCTDCGKVLFTSKMSYGFNRTRVHLIALPRLRKTPSPCADFHQTRTHSTALTLSDPTSGLVREYDFRVLLQCRKTYDTVFVAFVRPLSEPVRRFSSCSTDFSQQIPQVVLFLFLHVFLF